MNLRNALVTLALLLGGCGVSSVEAPIDTTTDELGVGSTGGVFATFEVADEHFSVWLRGDGMRDAIKLWKGRVAGVHPSGPLVCSSPEWNSPWSWHLDGKHTRLVEVSIELCDGRPSDVELVGCGFANGTFCPWSAQLIELRDCRDVGVAPPSCPVMPR